MPVVVVVYRLTNFDEWLELFKANPPPKVGHWRVVRGMHDRNRVHVVGEVAASELKAVQDFFGSEHMRDVFKRVNAISTTPPKILWLEELTPAPHTDPKPRRGLLRLFQR